MELTEEKCLAYLEKIRWNGKPTCPYCGLSRSSLMHKENRYHCNHCFTSYSVKVKILFHGSNIKLVKWFRAIYLIELCQDNISARNLAKEIGVTKNTALSITRRIRDAKENDQGELIKRISYFYKDCVDKADKK